MKIFLCIILTIAMTSSLTIWDHETTYKVVSADLDPSDIDGVLITFGNGKISFRGHCNTNRNKYTIDGDNFRIKFAYWLMGDNV